MSNISTPVKIAIAAGITLTAAGIGYMIMQKSRKGSSIAGRSVHEITNDQVIEIIDEIASAQNKMKKITQTAIREVISNKLGFNSTYDYCVKIQPADPLQKYGLTTGDFDQLLDREQHDPRVRERLAKIMGMTSDSSIGHASSPRKTLDEKALVEIHEFMLKELKKVSVEVDKKIQSRTQIDMRALAVAAQVLVGARVQENFGVDTDDIESSIVKNHAALSVNTKFGEVNDEIQRLMARFFDIQTM